MIVLTYRATESAARFLPLLRKAAGVWNDVLEGHVVLREWTEPATYLPQSIKGACNILVEMGAPGGVRNALNPTRVAHCQWLATDYWRIQLAPEVTWATSWWSRLLGRGEDALPCLIHELGHVFKLPHASNPDYVMHPEIGGTGKLSTHEKTFYRRHFLEVVNAD